MAFFCHFFLGYSTLVYKVSLHFWKLRKSQVGWMPLNATGAVPTSWVWFWPFLMIVQRPVPLKPFALSHTWTTALMGLFPHSRLFWLVTKWPGNLQLASDSQGDSMNLIIEPLDVSVCPYCKIRVWFYNGFLYIPGGYTNISSSHFEWGYTRGK